MRTNSKLKNLTSYFLLLTSSKGFTLIELLVVVSLVGMVMVATVGLLFSVIRSSRKSESLNQVNQAGNHTLEVMSSMIRGSQEVTSGCSGGSLGSIQIKNPDGLDTILKCDLVNYKISSESAATTEEVDLLSPAVGFDFTLDTCSFTCTSGTGNAPDSVAIQFSLTLGGTPDNQASATFNTTASLRNY
jgi:prepilin-type N-terminal cleavage/methylation domain-containing protein